jgi:broad specificity phosphatase PhoE
MTSPDDTVPMLLCRHGPTTWNAAGRVQGQTDIPLSDAGRQLVRKWRIPAECEDFRWIASPLIRAQETAKRLGAVDLATDPRLKEASWGDWDGWKLADIRATFGEKFTVMEAAGLDFHPPNGESPRIVQERLKDFLIDFHKAGQASIVVCHKGIIRAFYSLATGWDMKEDAPDKLGDGCCHLMHVHPDGRIGAARLNIPLSDNRSGYAW